MTRRTFTLASAAASALPLSTAAPTARLEPIRTITQTPQYYAGWPTLTRRKNGELLVAYSGGRESHVCPFGRVELIRSRDDGDTWSWPETIMDTPIDDRDAGICETPSGALVATTFTSLAYQDVRAKAANWPADRIARWGAVERRGTQEQFQSLLDTWMLRSADGGMTWSQPYRVPVNSPHGPSVLASGTLIYAGKQLWSGGKIGVCISKDDGRSWTWLAEIPARPGDNPVADYHELHQVEAADGRLIVHIRHHGKNNERETLQTESTDGGRSWSVPGAIGVWGLPSHLLRLRGPAGVLVMTYGYRRSPFGNQARISRDHGKTWSEPITLSADGVRGDLGYPSTIELADGRLVTVWYEQQAASPQAVLRMVRWKSQ